MEGLLGTIYIFSTEVEGEWKLQAHYGQADLERERRAQTVLSVGVNGEIEVTKNRIGENRIEDVLYALVQDGEWPKP